MLAKILTSGSKMGEQKTKGNVVKKSLKMINLWQMIIVILSVKLTKKNTTP